MGETFAREFNHKGIRAVELSAGGYYAVVAPTVGANVLRLRDVSGDSDILRYDEEVPISEIAAAPYLWGLQPLYPQNRFDGGMLKASDAVYSLPVNEPDRGNHIHGFIHERAFRVSERGISGGAAFVEMEYRYDESDYFYNCLPAAFRLSVRAELSDGGLRHTMTFFNESKRMLPLSVCAHTAIKTPFADGGRQEDIRLTLPITERVIADESRWLPTGAFAPLNDYDMLYNEGKACPVLRDINNNHYRAGVIDNEGVKFHGCVIADAGSGKKIFYETDEKFKFWVVWNDGGFNNYFCPEPLTAMINAPNLALGKETSGYEELPPGEKYSLTQTLRADRRDGLILI